VLLHLINDIEKKVNFIKLISHLSNEGANQLAHHVGCHIFPCLIKTLLLVNSAILLLCIRLRHMFLPCEVNQSCSLFLKFLFVHLKIHNVRVDLLHILFEIKLFAGLNSLSKFKFN
jgi:hypothetical protein